MVVQVNPYHVKSSKELDDNSPSKSDRKDPKTIAMLVKDGRYQIPYIPKGKYAELRKANNLREEWLKKIWAIKNKVQRWLDTYFPEFLEVFSSWEGKVRIPDYPDGNSGGIRTLNRRHPDTLSINLILH